MGTKGTEIIGMDPKELIELLNRALADEWLAYYQYWVGARVVKGPMRGLVESELNEHAAEELKHAEMLAERIIQIGGDPLLTPDLWNEVASCAYKTPENHFVRNILEQNIEAEQCAIDVYNGILRRLKDANDPITFNMIRKIMEDEVEHEDELQAILEDMDTMKDMM